jgi:hypothetical protein
MATTLSSPASGRIAAPVSAPHAFPRGPSSAEARVTVEQLVDEGALHWSRDGRLVRGPAANTYDRAGAHDGISPY